MTRPRLLYRPLDGWVGDVIPFHANGEFHVFYLFDDRDARGPRRGLDWAHLRTTDLLVFEDADARDDARAGMPDLFVEGGEAYLLSSSFSDRFATRYRRAATIEGPRRPTMLWRRPTSTP